MRHEAIEPRNPPMLRVGGSCDQDLDKRVQQQKCVDCLMANPPDSINRPVRRVQRLERDQRVAMLIVDDSASAGSCAAALQYLNNTHRVIPPGLAGNPCLLTVDLQLAVYRSLIEAVSLLLELETRQVCIRARSGRAEGRRGIVVVVSLLDRSCALSTRATHQAVERLPAGCLPTTVRFTARAIGCDWACMSRSPPLRRPRPDAEPGPARNAHR